MRLLLLFAFVLPSASAAAPAPDARSIVSTPRNCAKPGLRMAKRGQGARVTRLGDEPPAMLAFTVYREVGGCPEPAVLVEGIGSGRVRGASGSRR